MLGTSVDKSELKKVESQLDALYKKYSNKNISLGADTKKIDSTTNSIKKLNTGISSASKETMTYTSRVKSAIIASSQWAIGMGLLYGSIRKVSEAFDFTVEVDARMTEIAQVTGQTREQVQGLSDDYLQLSIDLKASTSEVMESAVALYRQGLNAKEVEVRLEQIAMAAQTAGVTIQQATDFVTVGINAMNIEAEHFNDVLLKTASISATDYQALGEMIQKTGASFANANIELEKGVSWLAQVQETSRLASTTIGTA